MGPPPLSPPRPGRKPGKKQEPISPKAESQNVPAPIREPQHKLKAAEQEEADSGESA